MPEFLLNFNMQVRLDSSSQKRNMAPSMTRYPNVWPGRTSVLYVNKKLIIQDVKCDVVLNPFMLQIEYQFQKTFSVWWRLLFLIAETVTVFLIKKIPWYCDFLENTKTFDLQILSTFVII